MSGLVDVAELMSDPDFAQPFTVKRPTGDFDAGGIFRVTRYEETDAIGSVQPARPETIQMLPEGERTTELIEIWTATEVRKSDAAKSLSDVIVYESRSFRVVNAEGWAAHGYTHVVAEEFSPPTGVS
jgi:hypothetical protein